ncbi:major facilitator superfamily domain-containing protein 6 [Parasteatoda tepidariorum]|uniref:major facilitator superfamily domain-containing protein 6 n=1 Tax=Parasteatoda tepidariorum TaxID=114398 RepID=UPI00077FAB6C|nr:major facilitator superfamily domain-containing protein 6-like [Parasteatoda tepidariorum]XP_015930468.1 major facilitator superfamily domain-containing protein 6-like [Parasteatoda tepidariorum]XP_042900762.1 major facilitator superfamily domain-containing protein 6-like [Parasteatoda tepidariorum]
MDEKQNGLEISVNHEPHEENKNEARRDFCHIDKQMVRFKIHFFLFFGAMGTMLPYVPLVAKDRIGISATSLATVLTVLLFSTVLTKTVLGYIADYFKRIKVMMSVLIILHCLFFLTLLIIPPVKKFDRNAQNLTLSNYFQAYENETEFTFVSMKRTGCDASDNLPTDFNAQFEDKRHQDVFCFKPSNVTIMFICFQSSNDSREAEMALQTLMNFCCSIYTSKLEQFYTALKTVENNFHFASLELGMANTNSNMSSHCSVKFFDKFPESSGQESGVNDFQTYQFWLYSAFMILAGNCASSAFTFSDTICCESVKKYKRDFGRQRIYSAISWGLLAPAGGLICDLTNDFYATWIFMASLQCITLWNLFKMDLVIPQFSQNLAKDVGKVLKSPSFLAFNISVLINGIWSGIIWYYLVWFISSLGASTFLCGLIPYVQCFAGELPIMFFSGWIIEKIGHFNSLTLSLLSYAVRFLWYSYLQNPWLVLPIEIVHGFTYGLFYPTVASFGKLSARTGTEATTQSILFSTHEGLGAGIGCILAGIGFDTFGGHWTFFYFSILAFGAALLNICSTVLVAKGYLVIHHEYSPPKG